MRPLTAPTVVGIIGTRGIPNRYGGFERFVEQLVHDPLWSSGEFSFLVFAEGGLRGAQEVIGDRVSVVRTGLTKSSHPLAYYAVSAELASRSCQVVMSCGVGVSVFAALVRLRGRRLIVNPDGCEWRREKWSALGRLAVLGMNLPALAFASRIVIDARALRRDFGWMLFGKETFIPYQAPEPYRPQLPLETDAQRLRDLGILGPFVLVVARLEPENNIESIVRGFLGAHRPDLQLIVVGGTGTRYYSERLSQFEAVRSVKFIGPLYEQGLLNELRFAATVYVHGHSVGGTNPSLLEALSTVTGELICHDNPYNREVAATDASYFSTAQELASLIARSGARTRVPLRRSTYRPDVIARAYRRVFMGF